MADLKLALPTIFLHEGYYSDKANDPGLATNMGISLRFLYDCTGDLDKDGWPDGDINHDGKIDVWDIKNLTKEKATELYNLYFWKKNKYGEIDHQDCATKIFDLAVNMGSYPANKIAQRAIRAAIRFKFAEDGVIGNYTLYGINSAHPDVLLAALKSEAAGYYRSIKYKGSQDFLTGWLNRAYSDNVQVTDE